MQIFCPQWRLEWDRPTRRAGRYPLYPMASWPFYLPSAPSLGLRALSEALNVRFARRGNYPALLEQPSTVTEGTGYVNAPGTLFLSCGEAESSTLQVPTCPQGEAPAAQVGAGSVTCSSCCFLSPASRPPSPLQVLHHLRRT